MYGIFALLKAYGPVHEILIAYAPKLPLNVHDVVSRGKGGGRGYFGLNTLVRFCVCNVTLY